MLVKTSQLHPKKLWSESNSILPRGIKNPCFDIHQFGSISFPEEHGQNAPVGAATAVSLRANQITRTVLPWNKENCTDKFYDEPEYDGHYTYRSCQKGCLQRHLKKICGCVTSLYLKKNEPVCDMLDKTTCMSVINYFLIKIKTFAWKK